MDLTAMTDSDLGALQLAVVAEQSRRARVTSLPDDLAALARDAAAAGCDRDDLIERVADALTTDEETAP